MELIPLEFLLDASPRALEDLELAALNRSANLSKTLKAEVDAWIEQQTQALITRWMIENREALLSRKQLETQPQKVEWIDGRERKKTA